MTARRQRVFCDGCGAQGGSYGVKASAAGLRNLRKQIAALRGWVHQGGRDLCGKCQ